MSARELMDFCLAAHKYRNARGEKKAGDAFDVLLALWWKRHPPQRVEQIDSSFTWEFWRSFARHAKARARKILKLYRMYSGYNHNFQNGGCFAFATYLKRLYPEQLSLYGLAYPDHPAGLWYTEHVLVKPRGHNIYIDSKGARTEAEVLASAKHANAALAPFVADRASNVNMSVRSVEAVERAWRDTPTHYSYKLRLGKRRK